MTRLSTLDRIKGKVAAEGYQEGTPQFEGRQLELQVEKCCELQRVPSCSSCPAYDSCELVKKALFFKTKRRQSER